MPTQKLIINPEDGETVVRAALSKVNWGNPVTVTHPDHPDVLIRRLGNGGKLSVSGYPEIPVTVFEAEIRGPGSPYSHSATTTSYGGAAFKYGGCVGRAVACDPFTALSTAWDAVDYVLGKGRPVW